MNVDLELAPKTKRGAGAPCCEPVVYPDVQRGQAQRMAAIAKALGDPIRLQLVDVLRKHAGKVCVCELVPLFDLSQPTVSHHLKKLRDAGIVGSERQGLWAYYYVNADALEEFSGMAELTGDGQTHLFDPQELYRRWEDGQWSPFAIDLGTDLGQWRKLDEEDRGLIFWVLSSLMVAEERITTKFSGLVGAYGTEEEATFLATQQVDEARHMQFYARFQNEVVADPAAIAAHVERAREQISPAFRTIFDVALVEAHEQLLASPCSAEAKVRFVTLYHQILEGTLGLTSFNFVTGYLEREGLLPGFVDGYSRIHHDEQRHIAYGTWYLREAVAGTPALADVVRATLRELLPAVAESLTPPDRDGSDWDALGANAEDIREFAIGGLTRRLNIVGVPLSTL